MTVRSSPLPPDGTVVIVGASLAGLRAAEELHHLGFAGRVVVVGDEPHPPYDRPPLSKQVLAGKWDAERIHHRTPDKLDALGFDLRLGVRATSLDTDARIVSLADGTQLSYDGLVIATGATPRRLPGTEGLAGVTTLRTIDDCLALTAAIDRPDARLVVIGAGFIGAEVAATCHGRGVSVTVVEALPVPLARVVGEEMGSVCAALHAEHGVPLRAGVGVEKVVGSDDGRSTRVHLADGSVLDADAVVVGIGVIPATDWLAGSGVTVTDGVLADASLFAAERVVVAGDVARWPHPDLGEVRIEHWTNASEQGVLAAQNLLAGSAEATPFTSVPFFWSDQYETKIQVLGRPQPDDEVVVAGGSVEARRFVALYRRGDRLGAVLAMSQPRQLMGYRPLLEARASFDEALAHARA